MECDCASVGLLGAKINNRNNNAPSSPSLNHPRGVVSEIVKCCVRIHIPVMVMQCVCTVAVDVSVHSPRMVPCTKLAFFLNLKISH